MLCTQRKTDRLELIRYLGNCRDLFLRLKAANPCFDLFENWHDVIDFMLPEKLRSPPCDNLIRCIISQLNNSIKGVTEILFIVFWPLFEIIYSKFIYKFDLTADKKTELWRNIQWAFLKVLNRIDLGDRESPVASKVYNDIYHEIYQIIISGLELDEAVISLDSLTPDKIDEISEAEEDSGNEFYNSINELEICLKHRVIDELEYHLLVGTIIYDDPLKEVAADLSIGYELAKKRRQRAVKKVKEFLKKLSPNYVKHPL